jgi:hypothetical protein
VERRAEEVHVGARVREVGLEHHLRCHVARRADDVAVTGERSVVHPVRDAPVEEVDLSELAHHHVLGLDVPVHDAVRVRERQRVTDLAEDREEGSLAITPARLEPRPRSVRGVAQERLHRGAVDALHDQDRLLRRVATEREHRHDVRVLDERHHARFFDERRGRALSLRPLERDLAPERSLRGRVHDAHAALAEARAEDQIRRRWIRVARPHALAERDRGEEGCGRAAAAPRARRRRGRVAGRPAAHGARAKRGVGADARRAVEAQGLEETDERLGVDGGHAVLSPRRSRSARPARWSPRLPGRLPARPIDPPPAGPPLVFPRKHAFALVASPAVRMARASQ